MSNFSRHSLFARDIVRCVLRSFVPGWKESVFEDNRNETSPFTTSVREAVQWVLHNRMKGIRYDFEYNFPQGPINLDNYTSIILFLREDFLKEKEVSCIVVFNYCIFASVAAFMFYQNGIADAPDLAIRHISGTFSALENKGLFTEAFWTDLENMCNPPFKK